MPCSISALITEKAEAQTTIVLMNEAVGKRCTLLYNVEAPGIVRMVSR
jgi:hypothetical protein